VVDVARLDHARSRTLQNRPSLAPLLLRYLAVGAASGLSGGYPIERSSLTDCWVVWFFIAGARKERQQRQMNYIACRAGRSFLIGRMASKNAGPHSPTVPPISHSTQPNLIAVEDEILDRIGDMRDHLDGGAAIVAAPFLVIMPR